MRHVREQIAGRPRHLLLFALVLGLLTGPQSATLAVLGAGTIAVLPSSAALGGAAGAAVLGGAALGAARRSAVDHGPADALVGRFVAGTATLLEPARRRPHGTSVARVRLRDGRAAGDVAVLRIRRPFRWPVVGAEVSFRGTARPVEGPEAWQRDRGAHVLVDAVAVRTTGARRDGLMGVLDGVRERSRTALTAGVPPTEAALLRGMVLGDDGDVPEPVRSAFERTSLAHLLAVSGQNVVLLATLVMAVAAAAGASLRLRLAAALACVLVYVPLTGAGAPIQRAGVMGAAGLVAALAGRPASRWYALGLAAAITLAWNPHAVRDVGWQLSFAAVVALLAGVGPLRAALRRRRVPGVAADALSVTIAATLGTAPLLALHFDQFATVGVPANLLAAPAVPPLMWLGMVAAAVGQVDPALARPAAELAGAFVAYVGELARAMDAVPYASVAPDPAATAAICVAAPLALALIAAGGDRVRAAWRAVASRAHAVPGPPAPARHAAAVAVVFLAALAVMALVRGHGAVPPRPGELVVSFQTCQMARAPEC